MRRAADDKGRPGRRPAYRERPAGQRVCKQNASARPLRHPELVYRIVVPAALKWEARDKLDQANITERVLFPGLDGLSRVLKQIYTPRKK